MNDFADNEEPSVFKNLARRICEIDRALNPITKAKLLRQAHCSIAHRNHSTGTTDFLDDVAAVMRFNLLLDRSHHIRRAEVYFLARCCAAGN